jgi:hypothetical protein
VIDKDNKREAQRESRIAIIVVACEFLTWLVVTFYFFNSSYSQVSDLSGFVFGFPAISLLAHLFFFLTVPRTKPQRREVAKYACFHVLFFTVVGYTALFLYLLSQPYK